MTITDKSNGVSLGEPDGDVDIHEIEPMYQIGAPSGRNQENTIWFENDNILNVHPNRVWNIKIGSNRKSQPNTDWESHSSQIKDILFHIEASAINSE